MTRFIVCFCKKLHRVYTAGREGFKMLKWVRLFAGKFQSQNEAGSNVKMGEMGKVGREKVKRKNGWPLGGKLSLVFFIPDWFPVLPDKLYLMESHNYYRSPIWNIIRSEGLQGIMVRIQNNTCDV